MPDATGRSAFDAADRNRDGQVSAGEIKEVPGMATRFQELDTNHDGMLSRAEFGAAAAR
jgi:Ca2+-binding EF-hand superfamily protein